MIPASTTAMDLPHTLFLRSLCVCLYTSYRTEKREMALHSRRISSGKFEPAIFPLGPSSRLRLAVQLKQTSSLEKNPWKWYKCTSSHGWRNETIERNPMGRAKQLLETNEATTNAQKFGRAFFSIKIGNTYHSKKIIEWVVEYVYYHEPQQCGSWQWSNHDGGL